MLPTRLGNAHPNIVPYSVFAASDGYLILAVANDRQFASFVQAAGMPELAADSRFSTNAERVAHREALIGLLKPLFAQRTLAVWIAVLEAANVPCGPINRIDQVFADPQAIARGLTIAMQHATGPMNLVASPLRLSGTPPEYRHAPPLLGEHTDEILKDMLAIQPAEIARLRDAGIV
jgi:crotonobetainyl-CoA:carnitine CoA-transferase CaiB-like acyl-CoA transferase